MTLDPHTLAAAFVLLSAMLGVLLLFAWTHNRKIHALAWWGATFCLIPMGIGMANVGHGAPGHLNLLIANSLVTIGYGCLYAGGRSFNGVPGRWHIIAIGPAIWIVAFPFIQETLSARLVLLSLISGGYAALSGWELWKRAPERLTSQRAAVILLYGLAAFNLLRAVLGASLNSLFGISALASRWSAEMALFLVVYAPTLAFVFLSMAREKIELALRESEEHYRSSVELNPQIPWTADPQGNILDVSFRWHDLFSMRQEETRGQGWIKALHPDDVVPTMRLWQDALLHHHTVDTEYRLRLADGTYRWFRARGAPRLGEDGSVIRWYGSVEDIHDRKVAEKNLHWAAHHDELTRLANRRLFLERLRQALDQDTGSTHMVGLLVMDLDHLKTINDRFGHDAGDALLQEFAARLCSLVRTTDTVARIGGDEFAIILTDIPGEEYVATTAASILVRMREPFRHRDQILDCRTSIGGAVVAGDAMNMEEFQKQADLALFRCKATSRGTFKMYRSDMREEAQRMASAIEVARKAVASDWIVPFYQPKVALKTGILSGFEALLRWRDPRMGIHLPETMAPAFEDTELGRAIGACMLSSVLVDLRTWLDAGIEIGRIAINASTAEFRHDDYAERVLEELRLMGLPASCLEIEVTESVFMGRSSGNVERALRTLSTAGVAIALDDFGTGYASLTHLKRFPVNAIKIDRSFIRDMETDVGDAAIVKALLSLGQSLGIKVVAEGVETAAQASFLREHGCDLVQGYYFGRPLPAEDIPQFIASWMHSASAKQRPLSDI